MYTKNTHSPVFVDQKTHVLWSVCGQFYFPETENLLLLPAVPASPYHAQAGYIYGKFTIYGMETKFTILAYTSGYITTNSDYI